MPSLDKGRMINANDIQKSLLTVLKSTDITTATLTTVVNAMMKNMRLRNPKQCSPLDAKHPLNPFMEFINTQLTVLMSHVKYQVDPDLIMGCMIAPHLLCPDEDELFEHQIKLEKEETEQQDQDAQCAGADEEQSAPVVEAPLEPPAGKTPTATKKPTKKATKKKVKRKAPDIKAESEITQAKKAAIDSTNLLILPAIKTS